MKTISALIIPWLFPLLLFGQIDENNSGNQTFSIKKTKKSKKQNGNLQFKPGEGEENVSEDKTAPVISILSPKAKRGFKRISEKQIITVTGKAADESGIFEVYVNKQEARVANDGTFKADIPLKQGDNEITVIARDIAKNSGTKTFVIERRPKAKSLNSQTAGATNKISWEAPQQTSFSTSSQHFTIKACINAKAIQQINIYKNGWQIANKSPNGNRKVQDCDYRLEYPVDLKFGENRIKVEVVTANGSFESNTLIHSDVVHAEYHALIIGVEEYNDPGITNLDRPIDDAEKLYDVLNKKYGFKDENTTFLKNPTKSDIIGTLHGMRQSITKNDNLLIFYAGHGYWDEDMNNGYWLPQDANQANPVNWLPNTDLTNYLNVIDSKHTLLIADACFSGGIFKTRNAFNAQKAMERLYQLPSRKAITSGTLNEVPDQSVFLKYLVKRLKANKSQYLTAEELFSRMRMAVINNSANIPQYGTIQNVGDEGGDFIFMKKQ